MTSRSKSRQDHEVWARIGFEFARSPFEWRIDDGVWAKISPDALTTDLMEIDFFCEVAWLKLGKASLRRAHTGWSSASASRRTTRGSLSACSSRSMRSASDPGEFRPNGKFKPDDDGRDAHDREAAETVFRLSDAGSRRSQGEHRAGRASGRSAATTSKSPVPWPCRSRPYLHIPTGGAIAVPGDKNTLRPDLVFAHRVWYRTRVEVPATAAGRSFLLVVPAEQSEHDRLRQWRLLRLRQEPVRPGADRRHQGHQAGAQRDLGRHPRRLVRLLGQPERPDEAAADDGTCRRSSSATGSRTWPIRSGTIPSRASWRRPSWSRRDRPTWRTSSASRR